MHLMEQIPVLKNLKQGEDLWKEKNQEEEKGGNKERKDGANIYRKFRKNFKNIFF